MNTEYDALNEPDEYMILFESKLNLFNISKHIHIIDNVRVLGQSSLILDANNNIINHLNLNSYLWSPHWINDFSNEEISRRSIYLTEVKNKFLESFELINEVQVDKAVYLLHPFGWYAFGHLYDTLNKLEALNDIEFDPSTIFLVSNYQRVVDFEVQLEVLLGYKPLVMQMPRDCTSVYVKTLIVPFSRSTPVNFVRDNYIWLREKYLKYFGVNLTGADYKLFLSRNHVTPGKRSILNEDEVLDILNSRGFVTLKGDEDLGTIVNYFYNSKVIIGYHGSLFLNIIFTRSTCSVLEFCANNRIDYSFSSKLKLISDYRHVLVDADDDFNCVIDCGYLVNYLDTIS